ncbi:MAG: hypothetical protein IJO57_01705 [Bacilli bacterium]|nr:hypothetical protein [Bacilli bacterium]
MKKNIFEIITIIITLFLLYLIIINKSLVLLSVNNSLNLWIKNLVPTLFPFFIISDILINYNIINYIPKFIKNKCISLFNITENMLTIFLLSIVSGFPSNARNAKTMYENKQITKEEANHILIFSHFANPAFILTTVSILLNNKKIGLIILLSQYLSNIILGILFRNSFKKNNINIKKEYKEKKFSNILINSIKKSINSILLICGIITMFLLVVTLLINILNLNNYNETIIKGIFEITLGIESLNLLNIPLIYKAVLTSIFISFGGISVHMQVKAELIDTDIDYHYFFIGRIYQMLLSGIITYIIFILT